MSQHQPIQQKFVDAAFPARGTSIPIDHGYALFSALSRQLPILHSRRQWAVHPVLGEYRGEGVLALTSQSAIKLRLPADDLAQILTMGGCTLDVRGQTVQLGFPKIFPIATKPHLKARLVVIKNASGTPEQFADAVTRQLALMSDLGQPSESIEIHPGPRRVLRIKNTPIVGYALALTGLSAQASLVVQCRGLGGRRHMGAGVFVPPGKRG